MFFKKNQDVCIEIRDDIIRYVELRGTDPVVVRRYGKRKLPMSLIKGGKIVDQARFKEFIAECIGDWKLKRKKIRFIEPDETVAVKVVTVPLSISDEEMRGYLYHDLGDSISLPFEHSAIDYVNVSKNSEGQKILIVATPEELVTDYVNVFRSLHLNPVAVDISPLCYYRLYLDQIKLDYLPKETLLLQVDKLSATVSIFEDHVPIFMQFEKLFADNMNWKDDVEMAQSMQERFNLLVTDIERILHFYQFSISEGKTIKSLILVGENPFLNYLNEDLQAKLDVAITVIPESIKGLNHKVVPREYHLAIGLGLKGVDYYVTRY